MSKLKREERTARFGLDCGDGVLFAAGTWGLGGEFVQRLSLQNVTGRSLHLRYTLPRQRVFYMAFPDPLTLPPGITTYLEVRFRPVLYAPLEDSITCTCETGTFTVPLRADIARLAVELAPACDFGLVPVAEVIERVLSLNNTGQVDAVYSVDVPQPFSVTPARGTVPAGASMPLRVAIIPGSAHKLHATARVQVWPAAPSPLGDGLGDTGYNTDLQHPLLPPLGTPAALELVTALSAHAKYQFISAAWPVQARRRGSELQPGTVPASGADGALAPSTPVMEPPHGDFSRPDAGPHVLQWGLVEADCGSATITGPVHGGSSDSPQARRRLTKSITVTNAGPVMATVSALRLFDGDGSGVSPGAPGVHARDGSSHPPPFTASPPSASLHPGDSAEFRFKFHPEARGSTGRTPLTSHWALSCPGGNVVSLVCSAVPVGPSLTIARKKTRSSGTTKATAGATGALRGGSGTAAQASASAALTTRATSGPQVAPPPDIAAGVRASVCFGDVTVGRTTTQVVVLTNHSATVPAHWAVTDGEAGCGLFLLSQSAGIVPPSSTMPVLVTFAPPCPGNFYRRLTFAVRDGDPVVADVIGTAYNDAQRPPPLRQFHVDRYRRLPRALRFLGPDAAAEELAALQSAAAAACGEGTRYATDGDRRALVTLSSAASREASIALATLPCASADRTRSGFACLEDMFAASADVVTRPGPVALALHPPQGMRLTSLLPAGGTTSSSSGRSSSVSEGLLGSYAPLDFGCVSRSAPPEKRSVWVVNRGTGKLSVTWVLPVPPAVMAGQPRLGAALLAHPTTTTALLQLPVASQGPDAVVGRDWVVTPESADVEPGGATEFRLSFRPQQDARYYSAVLEAYVSPKANRSFRLVDADAVLPPVCLPLRVMGHTFRSGMGRWIPRLETSFGGAAVSQHLHLPPCVGVPSAGPDGAAEVTPLYYTFQLANVGDVPVAYSLRAGGAGAPPYPGAHPLLSFNPSGGIVQRNSFHLVTLRLSPPPLQPWDRRPRTLAIPVALALNGVEDYTVRIDVHATIAVPRLLLDVGDGNAEGGGYADLTTRAGCLSSAKAMASLALTGGAAAAGEDSDEGGIGAHPAPAGGHVTHLKPASVGVSSERHVLLRNPSPVPLSYAFLPPFHSASAGGEGGGSWGPLTLAPARGDIPAGGIQPVLVRFSPSAAGAFSARLALEVTLLRGSETEPLAALDSSLLVEAESERAASGCAIAAFAKPQRRLVDAATGLEVRDTVQESCADASDRRGSTATGAGAPLLRVDEEDEDEMLLAGNADDPAAVDADDNAFPGPQEASAPRFTPVSLPVAPTIVQRLSLTVVSEGTSGELRFAQASACFGSEAVTGVAAALQCDPAELAAVHVGGEARVVLTLHNPSDCTLPFTLDAVAALSLSEHALAAALGRAPTPADIECAFRALCAGARLGSCGGTDALTRLLSPCIASDESARMAHTGVTSGGSVMDASPSSELHGGVLAPDGRERPALLTFVPRRGEIDARARVAITVTFRPTVPGTFRFGVYCSSSGAEGSDLSFPCASRDGALAAITSATAPSAPSDKTFCLLSGTAAHPTLCVEGATHLASREALLAVFPHHGAVLVPSGGPGGPSLVSTSSLAAGPLGVAHRRRRRSSRVSRTSTSGPRSRSGGRTRGSSSTSGGQGQHTATSTTARPPPGQGGSLSEAAVALGVSPLMASLLELKQRTRAEAATAADGGTKASRDAAQKLRNSLVIVPQLPSPLPADPVGWMRPGAYAREGVMWGFAEPVEPAPPVPGRGAAAPRDPARDWLFVLPDSSLAAPQRDPLPSASLWDSLSLAALNRALYVGPRLLRDVAREPPVQPVPFRFPPAPAGAPPTLILLRVANPGRLPAVVDVLWPGDEGTVTDVEPWIEEPPPDGDDHRGLRGSDGASSGTASAATSAQEALHQRDLVDRRVFDVAPRSLSLGPGQVTHVRVHYAYVTPGSHALQVTLRVRDGGPTATLQLQGTTVPEPSPAVLWPVSSSGRQVLSPVPLGAGGSAGPAHGSAAAAPALLPQAQPLPPLHNTSNVPVAWEVVIEPLHSSESSPAVKDAPPPLAVAPSSGVLQPGRSGSLAALCCPLEAKRYQHRVTLRYRRADANGTSLVDGTMPLDAGSGSISSVVTYESYQPPDSVASSRRLPLVQPAPRLAPDQHCGDGLRADLVVLQAGSDPLLEEPGAPRGRRVARPLVPKPPAAGVMGTASHAAASLSAGEEGVFALAAGTLATGTVPGGAARGTDAESAAASHSEASRVRLVLGGPADTEGQPSASAHPSGQVTGDSYYYPSSYASRGGGFFFQPVFPGAHPPVLEQPPPLHADAPETFARVQPAWLRLGALPAPAASLLLGGFGEVHRFLTLRNLRGRMVLASPVPLRVDLAGGNQLPAEDFPDAGSAGAVTFAWDGAHPLLACGGISVAPMRGTLPTGGSVVVRVTLRPARMLAAVAPSGAQLLDTQIGCTVAAPHAEHAERAGGSAGWQGDGESFSGGSRTWIGTTTIAPSHATAAAPGITGALRRHVPLSSRTTASAAAKRVTQTTSAAAPGHREAAITRQAPMAVSTGALRVTSARPAGTAVVSGGSGHARSSSAGSITDATGSGVGVGGGDALLSPTSSIATRRSQRARGTVVMQAGHERCISGGSGTSDGAAAQDPESTDGAQWQPPPPPHTTLWLRLSCEIPAHATQPDTTTAAVTLSVVAEADAGGCASMATLASSAASFCADLLHGLHFRMGRAPTAVTSTDTAEAVDSADCAAP